MIISRHIVSAIILAVVASMPAHAQISGGGYPAVPAPMTAGNCVKALNAYQLEDAGAPCGSGGGSGTVTSVTFTGDGTVLSSTPSSAVTTSGTVTGSLANATAKSVLGNSTSGATTPSWLTSPVVSGSMTADHFVSTVAIGTAPFTVTSTTNVPNLNASTLTGSAIGTTGATIPLLSTANTWGGSQTLSGGANVPTVGAFTNSTAAASTAFVNAAIQLSMATAPVGNVTGGTYSFASVGSGCGLTYTTTGGAITGITSVPLAGTNYAVGDIITPNAGNHDALLRVATVSGTGVATLAILYGGTGYSNASSMASDTAASVYFTFTLTGTLGSDATFIMTNGTYLTQSNQWIVNNNTTGAHNVTFKISNGSDTSTGTGVVIPQGSGNSLPTYIQSDGVSDIWYSSSVASQLVSNVSTGTAPFVVASTTNVANLNASSLNGATFSAPGAIGGGTAAAGTFTNLTTTYAIATGLGPANDSTNGIKLIYTSGTGWLAAGASDGISFGIGNLTAGGLPPTKLGGFDRSGNFSSTGTYTGTQLISTIATGTAPLTVASTTNVANLNASSLSGATFAAPGSIGSGTPGSGAFTTVTTTSPIAAAYGGTNNAYFQVSGPSSTAKTYTFPNSSQTMAALDLADQTLSGGANVTAANLGTKSSGTTTVDCGTSPLQYLTNGGAFTLAAPSNDGSCIVQVTNNGSAGTITFSGFSVGSNTGDALTTSNTSSFAISVWRINSKASYRIAAYQ